MEWLANQGPCRIGMEACAGAHHLARALATQWRAVDQPIAALDEQILAAGLWPDPPADISEADGAQRDATSQRLMAIPGVGPMLATALVVAVGSAATGFRTARRLPAPSALPSQRRSLRDRIDASGIDGWV